MKLESIKKIAVIGAGDMGSQIAEAFSRLGGYEVNITDTRDDLVKKGLKTIEDRLEKFFVAKGKITADEKKAITGRINGVSSLAEAASDVDFVIEAVLEIMKLKREIFGELDKCSPQSAILASNTSTLNITEMAAATKRPEKVIGMHFFNPVSVMKLVEVVKGANSSDETVDLIAALSRKLGKEPVICRDTSYGFLANRAYEALRSEAVQMVWEKVASPEDIDKSLKLGYNLPLGPLELADMLAAWGRRGDMEEDRIKELGEKGRLHPLIKAMIRAGYTGGPGKKGIYDFWKEVMSRW
ncbi:MAG: 3-hydroxyacyl-CoA dehydrogenase family protein [Thermodesulfobacteriota bacterium]|nr:3-hydroxyacyl-CoA dehydrogenase family protein [Thermodesulfobacteriota bacterium]